MENGPRLTSNRVRLPNSIEAFSSLAEERGWGDGLPMVPPTEARVLSMLDYVKKKPGEVIAKMAPSQAEATIEKISISAVMAGCCPEYLPVLIAVVKAITRPEFNLGAILSTTNPVAPLLIINGPLRRSLNVNCSSGAFGPGWRANATIGRAVRLLLINIGGAFPGTVDRSTQGQPGRYCFCVGENEEENPWPPLHTERGFHANDSCVTLVPVTGTVNVFHGAHTTAKGLLTHMINSMKLSGSNTYTQGKGPSVLAINPDHAACIARDGFSRKDAQIFLHENTRVTADWFEATHLEWIKKSGKNLPDHEGLYHQSRGPEDFLIVTVGGTQGHHSTYMPSFAAGVEAVTELIEVPGK